MNTGFTILITLLSFLLCAQGVDASDLDDSITTVTLRSTVRLDYDHQLVTLADLAIISGPQAAILQAFTINTENPITIGKWTKIESTSVRDMIDKASEIHAGSVVLQGNGISVTRRSNLKTTAQPQASKPDNTQQNPAGPTLLNHLESWVYARLKSNKDTTRIEFNQSNQSLLNTPTTGRIVEITEIGRSEKMSCRIVVYEHEQIILSESIRFDVKTKRRVRIAQALIRRRALIDDSSTTIETRWLSPVTSIADPEKSLGQASKNNIDRGTIILDSMVQSPVLIERGETISVKSITGSVSVGMIARAMSDGRLGELIEIESRDRTQRFTARVAGPGKAVIIKNPNVDPQRGT
jgi:flagella basal body P-ring formation protein FlgA